MPGTRTLNIVNCVKVAGGERDGRPWTIFEVTALNEQGERVELPLRSFQELPLGAGTYQVEPYFNRKSGETTYTLKPPNGGGGAGGNPGARLGPKVDELRNRVDLMEQQQSHMNDRLLGLEQVVKRLGAGADAPQQQIQQPASAVFGDDDVPF